MNTKILLSLVLLLAAGSYAQVEINCLFQNIEDIGYTCYIEDAEIGEGSTVVIGGEHVEGFTNDDVLNVDIMNSNVPRIPQEIFDTFPNLVFLEVFDSQLVELQPFENCINLRTFIASYNQLTEVPAGIFEGCPDLNILDLTHNQISEFHSQGLENLLRLDLSDNQLEEIEVDSFGNLRSLEVLNLNLNFIRVILPGFLSNLGYTLKELHLASNQISEVLPEEFNSLANCEILSLFNNSISSISDISFLGMYNLQQLDLGANQIRNIDGTFTFITSLTEIDLDSNRIQRLNAGVFGENFGLETILLSNNNIQVIEEGVFEDFGNLTLLNLEQNSCIDTLFEMEAGEISLVLPELDSCLPGNQVVELNCVFQNITNVGYTCWLTNIMLVGNETVTIGGEHLEGFTNNDVINVEIMYSSLSHIPQELFDEFPNLSFLDATGNELPLIQIFHNCLHLRTFIASSNEITEVRPNVFDACPNLHLLDLEHNKISEFHSQGLENLVVLNLADNELGEIEGDTFSNLRSIEVLNLNNNNIRVILPGFLSNLGYTLRELYLNYNQINEVIPEEFSSLANCEILTLYRNNISEIATVAFLGMDKLRELDLMANQLSDIQFSLPETLTELYLSFNRIERLVAGTFEANEAIQRITLDSNSISLIEEGTFDNLNNLVLLNLEDNVCINRRFVIEAGSISSILPELSVCWANVVELNCFFQFIEDIGYTCWIEDAVVTINAAVVIGGDHREGFSDEDVVVVEFLESRLSHVPQEVFDTFPNLTLIDVTGTDLSILQNFQNCFNLRTFNARYNNISVVNANVFEGCANLQFLDLSINKISEFHSQGLENVVELLLEGNRMSEVEEDTFNYLRSIEVLSLNNNDISFIWGTFLSNLGYTLRELYLGYNQLTEVTYEEFSSLANLEILFLYNNEISTVSSLAFIGLDNLRMLDLGSNALTEMPDVLTINTLQSIYLDNNRIEVLSAGVFGENTGLVDIELANNRIFEIEEGVFDDLENLEILDLSNNECIDSRFEIESGNISSVIPLLSVCLPATETILTCQYSDGSDDVPYTCFIVETIIRNPDLPVIIQGEHLTGFTDDDVERVIFLRSRISIIPLDVFTTFTNLQILDVSGSGLRSINRLENCENLQTVFASYNEIEVVQPNIFQDCLNLARLILSHNNINEFHSNGLSQLVELRLDDNNLQEIDAETFGYLSSVEILWLSDNGLSVTFPTLLVAMTNLRELSLGYNNFTRLFGEEFSPLVNLERLSFYSNQIEEIDGLAFDGLERLTHLDLGFNRITELGTIFSTTPALQELLLDRNNIRRLNANVFENNDQLTEIDLHANNIRFIEDGVFNNLQNLVTLRLRENVCVGEDFTEIENVSDILESLQQCVPRSEIVLECDFEDDDRGYLCILENVDVEEDIPIVIRGEHLEGRSNEDVVRIHFIDSKLNFIPQELFDTFPSLSTLDVTDTELPTLNALRNCENLENLFASYNNIEVVEANVFRECSNLRQLHLTRNNINEFHSNGLTNLVELRLNSNNISEIDTETFGYLENLEILYLNDNRIRYTYPIMLVALSNLRILYLSFNKITELFPEEFNPLVNLEELSLYGNRIQTVSPLAFRNLNNLRVLDLGNNRIENITDSFSLLPALETLFVDNNLIQRLARSTFANNTQLVELDLHGNRIREIEEGTFDQLLSLTTLRLDGNLCVNEDFEIEAGDIASILPALRRCNPLRDMVCRFDPMVRGYDCRIDKDRKSVV